MLSCLEVQYFHMFILINNIAIELDHMILNQIDQVAWPQMSNNLDLHLCQTTIHKSFKLIII